MNIPVPSQPVSTQKLPVGLRMLLLIPVALLILLYYTFIHEGGHALFGLLFGGKLSTFDVNFFNLSAHVGMTGEFAAWQSAVISAAGVSLPFLVWTVWMLLVPKMTNQILEWFKIIASIAVINSLLAWLFIPLLYLSGKAPADDSTNFLNITHAPPLIVSVFVLLAYVGGWALLLYKVGGRAGFVTRFQGGVTNLDSRESLRSLLTMAGVAAVMIAIVIGLNQVSDPTVGLSAPSGYKQVVSLNLAEKSYQNELIYQFELGQPTQANIFIAMHEIQTGPFNVKMTGPDGYEFTFVQFTSEKVGIGNASSHPTNLALQSGTYRIYLSVPSNPKGTLTVSTNGIAAP